jgi:hypothetical protein
VSPQLISCGGRADFQVGPNFSGETRAGNGTVDFGTGSGYAVAMRLRSCLLFVATVLAAGGCSSVQTRVDTGPIKARTFMFVNRGPKAAPAFADDRAVVHTMIQNALTQHLAAKGVTRVNSGADITVAYLVIVGNNVVTTSINDYFGYNSDAAALVGKAHDAQSVRGHDPNYFEAGTLVVDIIDTQTHSLLRRNYGRREILREVPNDVRAARIQEVVDEVLQGLRIRQ